MATQTAAELRRSEKEAYDAFLADCPTRQVLETIADKWAALLVTALAQGPRRHSELRRVVAGVSQKMLTQTLRTLERDGLVTRTITPSVPVRVDYELTDLGRDLLPVLRSLKQWSEANIERIQRHREVFDTRPQPAAS